MDVWRHFNGIGQRPTPSEADHHALMPESDVLVATERAGVRSVTVEPNAVEAENPEAVAGESADCRASVALIPLRLVADEDTEIGALGRPRPMQRHASKQLPAESLDRPRHLVFTADRSVPPCQLVLPGRRLQHPGCQPLVDVGIIEPALKVRKILFPNRAQAHTPLLENDLSDHRRCHSSLSTPITTMSSGFP